MRAAVAAALAVFAIVAVLATAPAAAQPPTGPVPGKRLRDQAELSFVDTGGNSDVTTLSLKNELGYAFTDRVTASWKALALLGESGGTTNAERYATELRLDYRIARRFYVFTGGGWLKDRFSGFDARYTAVTGGGFRFLTGPRHFLDGELGAAYADERYTTGARQDFLSGRAFARYVFALTDKSRFSQTVEYLHDFEDADNYGVNTETALTAALNSYMSLKVSYTVRYDNLPVPATIERTDTALSVTLVFNY